MLCGIRVSFPTLSRTVRQVAHALLTRPPLTQGRSPSSVRLECVMHAASVHPEPGSNSRKICIKTPRRVIQSSELDLLFTLLFVWGVFSSRIARFVSHTILISQDLALYSSLVVQFSMIVAALDCSLAQPAYYITFFPFCQYLFWNFFNFFSFFWIFLVFGTKFRFFTVFWGCFRSFFRFSERFSRSQ